MPTPPMRAASPGEMMRPNLMNMSTDMGSVLAASLRGAPAGLQPVPPFSFQQEQQRPPQVLAPPPKLAEAPQPQASAPLQALPPLLPPALLPKPVTPDNWLKAPPSMPFCPPPKASAEQQPGMPVGQVPGMPALYQGRMGSPSMPRLPSMDVPLPPPPPPPQGFVPGSVKVPEAPMGPASPPAVMPPAPPAPPRANSFDFPVSSRAPPQVPLATAYPQSFRETSTMGSFAEGLEQWRPPPTAASFQLRTEAAFAGPPSAPAIAAPNATYHGPQPIPAGTQQCPVQ